MNCTIWHFTTVSSTLDVAYQLSLNGSLSVWESVLAKSQTEGRGQMRRKWESPPGNIYASVRLPDVEPFCSEYAAPAFGVLIALAFARMMIPLRIKWPNDLVVVKETSYAKVGGILLTERAGILIAGIGINTLVYPDASLLRKEHAMPATSLYEAFAKRFDPESLWKDLLIQSITIYKEREKTFALQWKNDLEQFVLPSF